MMLECPLLELSKTILNQVALPPPAQTPLGRETGGNLGGSTTGCAAGSKVNT